jgi:hypothetical protein
MTCCRAVLAGIDSGKCYCRGGTEPQQSHEGSHFQC